MTVITLPAPPATVWSWLRDPALIHRWHGWQCDDLADEIELIFNTETTVVDEGRAANIGGHLFELAAVEADAADADADAETRLTVTRQFDNEYAFDIDQGWISFLQQLRFALARHPDDERRTHFLHGPTLPDAPLPITGSTWFESEFQRGIVAEDFDGLAIVYQRPDGSAMVIVTAYGLDDAAFDAIGRRLDTWWSS